MPAFLRHLFTLPRPFVIRWGGWIGAIFILAGIALPVAGFLSYRTIHHGVREEHRKVQEIAPEYLRASGSFDELLARAMHLQEMNEKQHTGMLDLTARSLRLATGSFFFIALFGVAILCARKQAIKERALEQALRERKDTAPSGDPTAE